MTTVAAVAVGILAGSLLGALAVSGLLAALQRARQRREAAALFRGPSRQLTSDDRVMAFWAPPPGQAFSAAQLQRRIDALPPIKIDVR